MPFTKTDLPCLISLLLSRIIEHVCSTLTLGGWNLVSFLHEMEGVIRLKNESYGDWDFTNYCVSDLPTLFGPIFSTFMMNGDWRGCTSNYPPFKLDFPLHSKAKKFVSFPPRRSWKAMQGYSSTRSKFVQTSIAFRENLSKEGRSMMLKDHRSSAQFCQRQISSTYFRQI